jgi:amidohydrolase
MFARLFTLADARSHPTLLSSIRMARRFLHQYPEIGHEEWCTATYIETFLRDLGTYSIFRPAPTSVAALIGPEGGKLLIFRADIDGLPIHEDANIPYKSQRAGFMHACGHDGHTAALLGVAKMLSEFREQLRLRVMLLFQQAEERHPSGAPAVIEGLRGRMGEELQSATYFGFHLWPGLPHAVVGLRPGPLMASVAGITITLTGGQDSDSAADALRAAVVVYQALSPLLYDRVVTVARPASLGLGRLEAGDLPQTIATKAILRGSLRALDSQVEAKAVSMMWELAGPVAENEKVALDIRVETGIRPPVSNDRDVIDQLRLLCDRVGISRLDHPSGPLGVSEDFGWYQAIGPGAYFLVGTGRTDLEPGLHSPTFDFDETALLVPITLLVGLATEERISAGRAAHRMSGDENDDRGSSGSRHLLKFCGAGNLRFRRTAP